MVAALVVTPSFAAGAGASRAEKAARAFFDASNHTNNWAVLVDTSRFWFNYRHVANTLSMYRTVRTLLPRLETRAVAAMNRRLR